MTNPIGWCNEVLNPVVGCSPVSAGCDNCFAARMASRFSKSDEQFEYMAEPSYWTKDGEYISPEWTGEIRFYPERLKKPFKWRKPRRIFVDSMGDLWHPSVTNEQIAAVFGMIAACPQHIFMDLTKRPERRIEWFEWLNKQEEQGRDMFPHDSPKWRIYQFLNVSLSRIGGPLPVHHGGPFPLPNYWAGVSVEDQPTADVRVSLLFKTPTAKRFVSYEPPLDGINFNFAIQCDHNCNEYQEDWCPGTSGLCMCQQTPNLIICGAETGPRRRMMNLDWARSVRDQCAAAGVPFWFKKDSEGNETLDGVEHKPEFWR